MSNPLIHINQLENVDWTGAENYNYILTDATVIWWIHIPSHTSKIIDLQAILHLEEQKRAYRYHREADKQRFIITRAYLRLLLSKYLSIAPHNLFFETEVNGKPYVKLLSGIIHYNVSHSGDYALIAICTEKVGIDVELINPDVHYEDIMEISFNPDEIAHVHESQNPIFDFYKIWTRKESLLKALGSGIDDTITNAPGLGGDHFLKTAMISDKDNYFIQTFSVDEIHIGSIANIKKALLFFKVD